MRNISVMSVLVLVSVIFLSTAAAAQVADSLRRELIDIRAQLDSLREAQLSVDPSEAVDRLSDRLDRRLRMLEAKIDAVSRTSAAVAFNPRTTAFLNFAGRVDSRRVLDAAGIAEIQNRPFLRTVEVDLRAPVDPYADAVVILALEDQAGTGFSMDPEEAYTLIKRLPLLESAPLGMKLKIGKFRAPIGEDNRLHMHDLPWITRPLVISRFLGTEHGEFFESGYNPIGADVEFFLPTLIPGTTWEMNVSAVRGGEIGLTQGHGGAQPAWIGHINASADWNNEHLLVLGASAYRNAGASTTSLVGVDALYKWAPTERRDSKSIVLGGEAYAGRHEYSDGPTSVARSTPLGWFAYAQYQASYSWYVGARLDQVEEPANDRLSTRALSAYVSYYTTEFLRLRAGMERRWSDLPTQNGITTGVFEVNVVFGSHPTEPYWVNR